MRSDFLRIRYILSACFEARQKCVYSRDAVSKWKTIFQFPTLSNHQRKRRLIEVRFVWLVVVTWETSEQTFLGEKEKEEVICEKRILSATGAVRTDDPFLVWGDSLCGSRISKGSRLHAKMVVQICEHSQMRSQTHQQTFKKSAPECVSLGMQNLPVTICTQQGRLSAWRPRWFTSSRRKYVCTFDWQLVGGGSPQLQW